MNNKHKNPPDRSRLLTEKRLDASADLDTLSVKQTLVLINDQDVALAGAVRAALPAIEKLVESVVAAVRRGGRLIYVGAGTSGRLGVLDASECPPTFHCDPDTVVGIIAGGDTSLRRSSEGCEDDVDGARDELERLCIGGNDTVVGIAAGGTTPYVLGAVRLARQRCATTALICCVDADPENAAADHIIQLHVGPEILTGSTRLKAGTATKLTLNMITTTVMTQLGKAWGNLMVDLRATNAKLIDRALRILSEQCDLSRQEARALLEKADGRVKLALVMARRSVDGRVAQQLLDQHGQQLRPIIGPPKDSVV